MSVKVRGKHGHVRRKDKKPKQQKSLWQKRIILGEKCKIPREEDDDTILYDEKGNKITTYHHRGTSSLTANNVF